MENLLNNETKSSSVRPKIPLLLQASAARISFPAGPAAPRTEGYFLRSISSPYLHTYLILLVDTPRPSETVLRQGNLIWWYDHWFTLITVWRRLEFRVSYRIRTIGTEGNALPLTVVFMSKTLRDFCCWFNFHGTNYFEQNSMKFIKLMKSWWNLFMLSSFVGLLSRWGKINYFRDKTFRRNETVSKYLSERTFHRGKILSYSKYLWDFEKPLIQRSWNKLIREYFIIEIFSAALVRNSSEIIS